jgi:hypothetical protein
MNSIEIKEFSPELKEKLPETYKILKASGIHINPHVKKITLHGSRGPAGNFRANSDIDLCLVTDIDIRLVPEEHLDALLMRVLLTTRQTLKFPVKPDVAVIFDHLGCGLYCFSVEKYKNLKCRNDADGCMGVFKLDETWKGILPPITKVEKMYPYLTIWPK